MRFSFADARVGTRRFGFWNAFRTNPTNHARAMSLFRACDRVSCTNSTTAPSPVQRRPASRFDRAITGPGDPGDSATSNRNYTAVATLLTVCHPSHLAQNTSGECP